MKSAEANELLRQIRYEGEGAPDPLDLRDPAHRAAVGRLVADLPTIKRRFLLHSVGDEGVLPALRMTQLTHWLQAAGRGAQLRAMAEESSFLTVEDAAAAARAAYKSGGREPGMEDVSDMEVPDLLRVRGVETTAVSVVQQRAVEVSQEREERPRAVEVEERPRAVEVEERPRVVEVEERPRVVEVEERPRAAKAEERPKERPRPAERPRDKEPPSAPPEPIDDQPMDPVVAAAPLVPVPRMVPITEEQFMTIYPMEVDHVLVHIVGVKDVRQQLLNAAAHRSDPVAEVVRALAYSIEFDFAMREVQRCRYAAWLVVHHVVHGTAEVEAVKARLAEQAAVLKEAGWEARHLSLKQALRTFTEAGEGKEAAQATGGELAALRDAIGGQRKDIESLQGELRAVVGKLREHHLAAKLEQDAHMEALVARTVNSHLEAALGLNDPTLK